MIRSKTRKEIAREKSLVSRRLPVSVACINFSFEYNVGFVVRSAACFGASDVFVIGKLPNYRKLRQSSCGMNNEVNIKEFRNTQDFLDFIRAEKYNLVSLELTSDSSDITEFKFPKGKVCILTGNESFGVPGDIIAASETVFIPMPGVGSCLNTSQALNIGLYEYIRQYFN